MKININKEFSIKKFIFRTLLGFIFFLIGLLIFVSLLTMGNPESTTVIPEWQTWVFLIGLYIIYAFSVFLIEIIKNEKQMEEFE